jgi:UTP--glucose-1-phosphate uridylyltransferase
VMRIYPSRRKKLMQRHVRKAVFPVAGLGTRFLPATKAIPKEMLPIVDQPVIQMAVDEARNAGIEHFIFVTGRNKSSIEDHFDNQLELETALRERSKTETLDGLEKSMLGAGRSSFTRQQKPLGLGHAIWCARDLVGDEPFAILLPDMVMKSKTGCLQQMMDLHQQVGGNVIAVEEVPRSEVHRYGVVDFHTNASNQMVIDNMIEKPATEAAPSNLIISGRYILQPGIFKHIESLKPGSGNEIQLTDAMKRLLVEQDFHGLRYEGQTFDCGSKLGFLLANVAYGLEHAEVGVEFRNALVKLLKPDVEPVRSSASMAA